MSTLSVIPTEEGLLLESRLPVSKEFVDKIENKENEQKIHAHLKDMYCEHHTEEDDHGTPISILEQWTYDPLSEEKFATMMKVMKANHDSFIENVNLRMKSPSTPATDALSPAQEDPKNKKLKAASEMLKSLEDVDDDAPIIFGRPAAIFLDAFGQVRASFLKEILDAYIDKQIANENNKQEPIASHTS